MIVRAVLLLSLTLFSQNCFAQKVTPKNVVEPAYADPNNPFRNSKILRALGLEGAASSLASLADQVNQYLQYLSPNLLTNQHKDKFVQELQDHFQNHPNEPFHQPIETWSNPTAGIGFNASRNVITGNYYGSTSQVQLVDTLSASVKAGGYFGASGILNAGVFIDVAQLQYQRTYVHIRPITNINTAWKDSWFNIFVPRFMEKLGRILNESDDQTAAQSMQEFLDHLQTGEMFIINDAITAANTANFIVPVGALLGLSGLYVKANESIGTSAQYVHLSRTTIYRDTDGLHVYIDRANTGQFEGNLDTEFFVKLLVVNTNANFGNSHAKAFLLPNKFERIEEQEAFNHSMRAIMRWSNTSVLENEFTPYTLNHNVKGHRFKAAFGPFSWTKRETYHQLKITPPERPDEIQKTRTIIEGQVTKVTGTDIYGFLGSILHSFIPIVNVGGAIRGDDPSSNFLGRSRILNVNSQIEITESKKNNFVSMMSENYNGWRMNSRHMLRILNSIQKTFGSFIEKSTFVKPEQFEQKRKIDSYSILWNLVIHEQGINRILAILNRDITPTKTTQQFLVSLMGVPLYEEWCAQNKLFPGFLPGPLTEEMITNTGIISEKIKNKLTIMGCVTPWMRSVYDYRAKTKKRPDVFNTDIRTQDQALEKIKFVNHLLTELKKSMSLETLIKWTGNENTQFQARVSGFRKNSITEQNEYFTSSVGRIDQGVSPGPLGEIHDETHIIQSELSAKYMSGGF